MERLRKLREEKRWTQVRLASEINVSQETVSGYETGKALPPIEILGRLADALGTSVDYLIGRSEVKSPLCSTDLSERERALVLLYRRQPQAYQACIFDMLKGLER